MPGFSEETIFFLNNCSLFCATFTYVFMCIQGLYDSIKQEPFKIPEDDGNDLMHTFFNPDREGWLWKQGKLIF